MTQFVGAPSFADLCCRSYGGLYLHLWVLREKQGVSSLRLLNAVRGADSTVKVVLCKGCNAERRGDIIPAAHTSVFDKVSEHKSANDGHFTGAGSIHSRGAGGNVDRKRLSRRSQFSWTAIISGHVNGGQYREALGVYKDMQDEGVKPSTYTLVSVLKACIGLEDLETGRMIHAQVVESGHESQMYVATMLVDMYVKCGSMVDACHVFYRLPHRDVVSWTAMILGCAKKEHGELGLQLYAWMQQQGVAPNERTFLAALKGCSSLATLEEGTEEVGGGKFVKVGCLEKGRAIHSQVESSDFQSNAFVGNTLISMYAKCGSMMDARQVFDRLQKHDVVSWTAMILGYAEQEEGAMALQLYARMQQENVEPNERTFVGALMACSSLATLEEADGKLLKVQCLEKGRAIHSRVVKHDLESDVFVGTMLMDMYVRCGSVIDARHVFDNLPHRDVVSWNVMILAYAQKEGGEMAMELYARMQQEGVEPDDRTFVGALKACSSLTALEEGMEVDGKFLKMSCLDKGKAIHCQLLKGSFEFDVFVGTTMLDMYAKCGSMVDARRVFDKLPRFDIVSWNAMILGYAEQGESEEAFKLYGRMQDQGLLADSVTFVGILKACGNTAALEKGKEIRSQIGAEIADEMVTNALLDMYGKCGSMVDAQQLFDALPKADLVQWNTLIAGYTRQGEAKLVFHLFEKMKEEGVQPNGVTFLHVVSLCSHAGLVHEGQAYFNAMSKDYGISPTMKHFSCMIDLLGRAGLLNEMLAMVETMPFQPNMVMWMTVLASCRKWTNVEIGRRAFECALRLDTNNASTYVLMSNIYADVHMWEDRDKVQAMREAVGAWKRPGQSWWMDSGGLVHTFVAGDTKHPHSHDIYAKLKYLSFRMKEEGYVPALDYVLHNISDDERRMHCVNTVRSCLLLVP